MEINNQPLYNSKKSGLAFSLSAILPIFLSLFFLITIQVFAALNSASAEMTAKELYNQYITKNWFIFASFLASQVSFLLIVLYFHFFQKIKIPNLIKGSFKPKYIIIGLIMSFGLLFGLSYVNDCFLKFLKIFGIEPPSVSIPTMSNAFDFILSIVIIAIMPAVLEELLFRGIILRGIKNLGTVFAVLICGVLFAIFHQNPSQTVYQFINGVLFALLALRSGSVIPSIILHFINNAYILTVYYLFPQFQSEGTVKIILIIAALIAVISATVYLIFFDKNNRTKKTESAKPFFKYAMFGILICMIMWITGLFL